LNEKTLHIWLLGKTSSLSDGEREWMETIRAFALSAPVFIFSNELFVELA